MKSLFEQVIVAERGEDGDVFSRKPNPFLVEQIRNRKPEKALDVGMGQGRNSIYLAQQGWEVTGFDTLVVGIDQARTEASRLGLKIHAELTSLEQFDFGEAKGDLMILAYEPTKRIAPKVVRAFRLGGAVVVEDRHLDTRRVWTAGTLNNNEGAAVSEGGKVCWESLSLVCTTEGWQIGPGKCNP